MRCLHSCKRILTYSIIIILFICTDTIHTTNVKNTMRFAGIVENITVYALRDGSYLENDNMLQSLKLNISWVPPNKGKQPSSYR